VRRWAGLGAVVIALCGALALGVPVARGDAAPQFARSTEPEVGPATAVQDYVMPFLGWAADPSVGFLGGGGLYADDGTLRVARACGAQLRAGASASTGSIYAFLGEDGRICVFEGTDPRTLSEVKVRASSLALARATSADGRNTLDTVVYTRGQAAVAIDGRSGQKLWSRDPDLGVLSASASSREDGMYAVGGERGAAVLYGETGRLLRAVTTARRGPTGAMLADPVHAVALNTNADQLLTGQGDGRVTMWDVRLGKSIRVIDFGDGDVVDVDWSADGQQISAVSRMPAVGSVPATLQFEVWDLIDDMPLLRESVPDVPGARPTLRMSPWGRTLIGSDGAGFTRVWRRPARYHVLRGDALREIPHHRRTRAVADPVRLATASDIEGATLSPGPTRLWPAPDGQIRLATDAESGASVWVDSATRKALAVYDADGAVKVRHALTQSASGASLTGEHLTVVGADGTVRTTLKVSAPLAVVKDIAGATAVATTSEAASATAGMVWGSSTGDVTFVRGGSSGGPRVYSVHAGPVVAVAARGDIAVSVGPRVTDPGATDAVPTLGVSVLLREPESRGAVMASILGGSQAYSWVVDGTTATVSIRDSLALVRTDRETVVFDLTQGVRRLTLPWAARDAAFADGDRAGSSTGNTVRWIDPFGRERSASVGQAQADRPRGRTLCADREGRSVATLDADVLTLWNGFTGLKGQSLAATGTPILQCAFNEGGKKLALLQADGRFEVWSVDSMTAQAGISDVSVQDPWFAFAPTTRSEQVREAATGESDAGSAWVRKDAAHLVRIPLRASAQTEVAETIELPAGVARIDARSGRFGTLFGPTGATLGYVDLVAALPEGGRRLWDLDNRPLAARGSTYAWSRGRALWVGPAAGPALSGPLHGANPVAAQWSDDGKLLAIADDNNVVSLIDLPFRGVRTMAAGSPPASPFPSPPVEQLWFDRDTLYGRDTLGRIRHWSWAAAAGGDVGAVPPGSIGAVPAIHMLRASPDGRTLYSGQADTLVRAWDVDTATQRDAYMGAVAPIGALAVSGDGKWLAVGADDGVVRVIDAVTKVVERSLYTFDEPTVAVAFAQEGAAWKLAAMSDSGVLRVWDLLTSKPLVHWTIAPFSIASQPSLAWLSGLSRLTVTLGGQDYELGLDGADVLPGVPTQTEEPPVFLGKVAQWVRLKGDRYATADALGHIWLWDGALQMPYARLTLLDDGGWISDRVDGRQIASESLRDGTSLVLYQRGGLMEPNTNERAAARVAYAVTEQNPVVQQCLVGAPASDSAPAGGTLELAWQVSAGVLRKTKVVANSTGSDALAACVVEAMQTMRFDLDFDTAEIKRSWTVFSVGAVRMLGLDAEASDTTLRAVDSAINAAKPPRSCAPKAGMPTGLVLQWHVEAGRLQVVPLAVESEAATVGACLANAANGARVESVERATGVWLPQ